MKDMTCGFSLSQKMLSYYSMYIIKTSKASNRQMLSDLRDLLRMMNPDKAYEAYSQERNTFNFLLNLVNARLQGMENRDLLIEMASQGVDMSSDKLFNMEDIDRQISTNEIAFIERNIAENRNKFYTISLIGSMDGVGADLAVADEAERAGIITRLQRSILDTARCIKTNVNVSAASETFSIGDDEQYQATISHIYNRNISGSTKLKCGMQAFNNSLAGGFENDRCYIYLALPGEGKSSTLLNLALQIKKYNPDVETKDPTKRPCILFLTMENTLDETLERMFSILVSDKGIGTYESSDEIMKLLIENGLTVNSENPIDLVVKYIPSNTVDTDYLYTLYDELLDDGKEIVCVIQDYIKRIKCRDRDARKEMRLMLGAVVDEFKEFAIAKHVPVITASQMNRDAARIIDEGRYKNEAELVRKVGRSNTGESAMIIENADSAFILVPEDGVDGNRYLGVSNAKKRFKNAHSRPFYQPYDKFKPLALKEDVGLTEPLAKMSLNELKTANQSSWNKPVYEVKPEASEAETAQKYKVSNEFLTMVNDFMRVKGRSIVTKDDVRKIVLGKGFLFGEMSPHEKDYLFIINGFDPENGTDSVVKGFETNKLESGEPQPQYIEAIIYPDEFIDQ